VSLKLTLDVRQVMLRVNEHAVELKPRIVVSDGGLIVVLTTVLGIHRMVVAVAILAFSAEFGPY
jgi:hypothetical protein